MTERERVRLLDRLDRFSGPQRTLRSIFSAIVGVPLYQLFGRALCAAIGVGVSIGFVCIPQVAEVLDGMADTFRSPQTAFQIDADSAGLNAHWFAGLPMPADVAYALFVGAALLLAWTTSWTTRGLQEAAPADDLPWLLRVGHPDWLGKTDRWVAAGSGAFVLLITQSAFLLATFAPGDAKLFGLSSFWFAVVWAGLPLLAAWLGTGLSTRLGWWTEPASALLAIAVAWGLWMASSSPRDPRTPLTILSATLPALYWLGWHAVARVTAVFYRKLSDHSAPIAIVRVLVLVGLASLLHYWLGTVNPSLARQSGSAGIALLELLFVTGVVFVLLLPLRFISWNLPTVSGVLLLGYLAWVWNSNPEQMGRETFAGVDDDAAQIAAELLVQRGAQPATDPSKMLAIHADGGGIRAAVFTALVMAAADDASCGRFGERLFAASGVSGGSIGIAMWMAARTELLRHGGRQRENVWSCAGNPATAAGRRENLQSGPLAPVLAMTLAQDHLSPVVASYLGVDLVSPLSEKAERGQALIDSLQSALREALGDEASTSASAFTGLATPISRLSAGRNVPWLLFSATEADNGQRIVFSNAPLFARGSYRRGLTLGVAALHSARFPLVSPPGEVPALLKVSDGSTPKWHDDPVATLRVVDGGYFDNSGAESLAELVSRSAGSRPKVLSVWRLNGNAPDGLTQCDVFTGEDQKHKDDLLPFSGAKAFLAVRGAHADAAVARLASLDQPKGERLMSRAALQVDYERDFDPTCPRSIATSSAICQEQNKEVCRASIAARKPPLGWFLTRQTVQQMTPSILPSALALAADAML